MTDKAYNCAYKYCLHHGEKVKSSESVVINKRHYHWDCAAKKQEIKDCVDVYMDCIEDKTQYPIAVKVINYLVFNNKVPVDYIKRNIELSKMYYADKPVQILYGLRKLFWERDSKHMGGE